MTLRYNNSLVAEGAIKDSEGNKITTTYAKSSSLATVATTGDYTDLTNTPTIPATQVQANWNETDTSSKAYIQNKPNIPSGVIVDQTYDGTSANAQSGVAIEGELANYALSSSVPTDTSDLTNNAGFITGISGSDVTTALGYTPANTSLSNIGATSSTNFDGQWVQSYLKITASSTANGSYSQSISSYLPADADNYYYEVKITSIAYSTGGSSFAIGTVASPYTNESDSFGYLGAYTNSNAQRSSLDGSLIFGNGNKTIYWQIANGAQASNPIIYLRAYRRIGTNT